MKNASLLKFMVLIVALCSMFVFLCSCKSSEKIEYYSIEENYINVTGIVSNIKYDEDFTVLYVEFSELSPALDDTCFKLVGNNLKIVQSNRIEEKIKTGEQVTFVTAPKYFGDGYVMPIVAISIHGEKLLEFEEGYENLLDWLSG